MCVVKLWHVTRLNIQSALFGCLELVLVDIPILVTNGCRMGAKGWDLAKADHLWPQIIQCLLVGLLEKLSGVSAKETALIKGNAIRLELLDSEVCEASHKSLL